jgi:hypothetical protein
MIAAKWDSLGRLCTDGELLAEQLQLPHPIFRDALNEFMMDPLLQRL